MKTVTGLVPLPDNVCYARYQDSCYTTLMRKLIFISLLLILIIGLILVDSGTISFVTTIENRRGLEYSVQHFEVHPGRLPAYFVDIVKRIAGLFRD